MKTPRRLASAPGAPKIGFAHVPSASYRTALSCSCSSPARKCAFFTPLSVAAHAGVGSKSAPPAAMTKSDELPWWYISGSRSTVILTHAPPATVASEQKSKVTTSASAPPSTSSTVTIRDDVKKYAPPGPIRTHESAYAPSVTAETLSRNERSYRATCTSSIESKMRYVE